MPRATRARCGTVIDSRTPYQWHAQKRTKSEKNSSITDSGARRLNHQRLNSAQLTLAQPCVKEAPKTVKLSQPTHTAVTVSFCMQRKNTLHIVTLMLFQMVPALLGVGLAAAKWRPIAEYFL